MIDNDEQSGPSGQRRFHPNTDETATVAALLTGLLTIVACAQAADAVDLYEESAFVTAALAHGAIYAVAAALVIARRIKGLIVILAVAAVLRGIALTPEPNLSTDAFRYVWDGRIQTHGFSPYLHVPADPRLAHLRDDDIYPNINQKERAVTIYPPAAELLFRASQWVGDSVEAIRLVMLGCDVVTIAALLMLLRALRRRLELILLYAWHPLPVWEFTGHGHIDSAVTAVIALGILAAVRGRQSVAGAIFAVAALLKYFPVVLLPALWRRWGWRMPAAFTLTAVVIAAPYAIAARGELAGYLGQHLDNEGYGAGWGFHPVWLLRDFGIGDMTGHVYSLAALAVLGALALYALFKRADDEIRFDRLMLLGAAFVFLTSPHYPWYFAFLVALLPLAPHPAAFAFTLLAPLLYMPGPPDGITWTSVLLLVYWLPLAILAAVAAWRYTGEGRSGGQEAVPAGAQLL